MINVLEKYNITEDQFRKVCEESSSATKAAAKLNLRFNTFKRYATKFGCYKTNQSGKGLTKNIGYKYSLEDVLNNKVTCIQTFKLKLRLYKAGIKEDKCERCGWCGKREDSEYSTCELHHKNRNRFDNSLENLEILCPNCHSLTDTYRSKNMKKKIMSAQSERFEMRKQANSGKDVTV